MNFFVIGIVLLGIIIMLQIIKGNKFISSLKKKE